MDFMSVGTSEILMILFVAILVIGPNRVIELGRTLGKIMRTIKKASFDLTSAVSKELELENKDKQDTTTAVRPFLVNYSRALISLVDQATWRRSYCPICGGSPDFAYLEAERGARWLICSRCDAEWLFQRLQCPYCQTVDQKDLSYYSNDDEIYRLYVCDKCKHYLKTIDLRKAGSGTEVSVERLLTYELDVQASEYGYLPLG